VARLEPFAAAVQAEVSGRFEPLSLSYDAAGGDHLVEILDGFREEELRRRSTAAGPHRDDLGITLHGMPVARFASEGQQRTTALALKIGQARLFLAESRRPPLLLLDDIFGELDPGRRNALMAALPSGLPKTRHHDTPDLARRSSPSGDDSGSGSRIPSGALNLGSTPGGDGLAATNPASIKEQGMR